MVIFNVEDCLSLSFFKGLSSSYVQREDGKHGQFFEKKKKYKGTERKHPAADVIHPVYRVLRLPARDVLHSAANTIAYSVPGSHAALTQTEQLGEVSLQVASDPGYLSSNQPQEDQCNVLILPMMNQVLLIHLTK